MPWLVRIVARLAFIASMSSAACSSRRRSSSATPPRTNSVNTRRSRSDRAGAALLGTAGQVGGGVGDAASPGRVDEFDKPDPVADRGDNVEGAGQVPFECLLGPDQRVLVGEATAPVDRHRDRPGRRLHYRWDDLDEADIDGRVGGERRGDYPRQRDDAAQLIPGGAQIGTGVIGLAAGMLRVLLGGGCLLRLGPPRLHVPCAER